MSNAPKPLSPLSPLAHLAPLALLSPQQLDQQVDLSRRILHMAYLGTPRVDSTDPDLPALLALHALRTTYLAMAEANPGITHTAALLAHDMAEHLKATAERRAATTH